MFCRPQQLPNPDLDEELATYSHGEGGEPYRIRPSRLRFAHTSPIYVTVDGSSAAVSESIEEGLRMLDRFDAFARKNASRQFAPSIRSSTEEARRRLRARSRK